MSNDFYVDEFTTIYNHTSRITNTKEVVEFFEELCRIGLCGFHPDDEFTNNYSNGGYMDDCSVEVFNRLMDESFAVCDEDIYGIAMRVYNEYINKN